MEKELNKEVLEFLKSHPECALATASSDGNPEVATVLFAIDDDFTFYFGTSDKYRKYNNLLKNKRIAVVVGVANKDPRSAQAEGEIEMIEGEAEIAKTKEFFAERNPAMKPFLAWPLKFFKMKPTWLRWLDETKGSAENYRQIIG